MLIKNNIIKTGIFFGIVPLLFYLLLFLVLTYPAVTSFNTHFFSDSGDGLQNGWNLWWINKSITELHISPWFTNYLQYPHGIFLYAQTLNPFNGLLGVILQSAFTLKQTYNFIIVFSFAVGGLTTFLLGYYLSRNYFGSIVAGYIFTFSSYHFAHLQGHMQLVALEWIPLFVLFFFILLQNPSKKAAFASATSLFLVILCDYYYFMYCVIIGCIIVLFTMWKHKSWVLIFNKEYRIPIFLFLILILLSAGPLVINLFLLNMRDPLLGAHNAAIYSTDLLAPFIPGGYWKFAALTESIWSKFPGNIHENSVFLGWSVLLLILLSLIKGKVNDRKIIYLFLAILFIFFVLSLGPKLHVAGKYYDSLMPYSIFVKIFPFIGISGCPVRMMVIVSLAASIIVAFAIKYLFKSGTRYSRIALGCLLLLLIFEYLPKPITLTNIETPRYVRTIKAHPTELGIADLSKNSEAKKLYFQTIHEKPMTFGYVSRLPTSVAEKNKTLFKLIQNRQVQELHDKYRIGFIIGGSPGNEMIYDIKNNSFLPEPVLDN